MESVFNGITATIEGNPWLAPLLAVVMGMLTSMTPCSLSTVPLVIGCIGNNDNNRRRAVLAALIFAAGSAVTFTVLGSLASMLGAILDGIGTWMHLILGVILLLMALQMFGVFEILPESDACSLKYRGLLGAFLSGMLAGAFASHCTTPVLVTLLAIAANGSAIGYGTVLLALFSLGHGLLFVVAGAFSGKVMELTENPKFKKVEKIIRTVLGIIILVAAVYLFYEALGEWFFNVPHEHHI